MRRGESLAGSWNVGNARSGALLALLAGCAWCGGLRGESPPGAWLTGRDFQRRLELPVDVAWSATASASSLRQRMDALARAQGVAIWLDRRIDPSQPVDFSSTGESLYAALQRLAAKLGAGVGHTDGIVYLGPRPTAAKFATLTALRIDEARKLPPGPQAAFLRKRAWRWPDLATPRELIAELAGEATVAVEGMEQIPHDLWAARDLPSLGWAERLSLVLAGFDLTFQFLRDGTAVRLVAMPEEAVLERTYAARGDMAGPIRALAERFPGAQVERRGARIAVRGCYEDHQLIERLLRGEKVQRVEVDPQKTRYTLEVVNQPLGVVLRHIARLGLAVEVDPRIHPKLQELVTFRVENATLEELVRAALAGRGIRFRLSGSSLQLAPAE